MFPLHSSIDDTILTVSQHGVFSGGKGGYEGEGGGSSGGKGGLGGNSMHGIPQVFGQFSIIYCVFKSVHAAAFTIKCLHHDAAAGHAEVHCEGHGSFSQ